MMGTGREISIRVSHPNHKSILYHWDLFRLQQSSIVKNLKVFCYKYLNYIKKIILSISYVIAALSHHHAAIIY